MKRNPGFEWGYLRFAAALVVGLAVPIPGLTARPAETCCFSNDRYEGMCRVTPGEGETCKSIAAYLNNPMSTGKSYCGGTSVRGGWVQVDCKTGKKIQGAAASARKAGAPAAGCDKAAGK